MQGGGFGNPFDFSGMAGLLNLSSTENTEEKLREISNERNELYEEVCSLNEKLEMAYALAEEKEAIALEARQESEASKLYAEQKEVEVNILEHSVEELECTINVLEKKVYEMNGEVDRHQLIRKSLEHEIQEMRKRLSTFENFSDAVGSFNRNAGHTEDQSSRYWNDKDVLQKLGEAMGLAVTRDAATSGAGDAEAEETDEVGNEDESIVHQCASVGDFELLV